jgi:hypothetical protein
MDYPENQCNLADGFHALGQFECSRRVAHDYRRHQPNGADVGQTSLNTAIKVSFVIVACLIV